MTEQVLAQMDNSRGPIKAALNSAMGLLGGPRQSEENIINWDWNQAAPKIEISVGDYEKGLFEGLKEVSEFQYFEKKARELGVEISLTGQTAATYANYVKWFLRSQKGDARYMKNRLDFHFLSIFPEASSFKKHRRLLLNLATS